MRRPPLMLRLMRATLSRLDSSVAIHSSVEIAQGTPSLTAMKLLNPLVLSVPFATSHLLSRRSWCDGTRRISHDAKSKLHPPPNCPPAAFQGWLSDSVPCTAFVCWLEGSLVERPSPLSSTLCPSLCTEMQLCY
mmetsp:Transcript_15359/g.34331  ORF Transcript_15359/g.34331 Transcript_15359/m.34331 type:complete len:134 (+) Transcript_15359:243-644(+)